MSQWRPVEELRGAGAELSALPEAERVERVAALLEAWASPESRWQRALCEALPQATGFSVAMVRDGCARGFAPFRGAALRDLVAGERAAPYKSGAFCTAFLAGAIPMPTLVAAVAPLVLGCSVVLKASAADRVSPELVARSAAEVDPLLGRCITATSLAADANRELKALLCADVVSITGSDESVAAVAALIAPGVPVVRHGHRFSAAVVGAGATRGAALDRATRALAEDVALWDQLGCLSPVGVWVVDPHPEAADRFAEALAGALADTAQRWPRGALDTAAKAAFHHAREIDAMRDAARSGVRTLEGSDWCVVRESDAAQRPVPLHRFIRVYPAANAEVARDALAADQAHLAALAVEGLEPAARATLDGLRPSRVCRLGALQTPPLAWRRDHLGVLSSLAAGGRAN